MKRSGRNSSAVEPWARQVYSTLRADHSALPYGNKKEAQPKARLFSIWIDRIRPVQGMSSSLPWVAGTSPSVSGSMR